MSIVRMTVPTVAFVILLFGSACAAGPSDEIALTDPAEVRDALRSGGVGCTGYEQDTISPALAGPTPTMSADCDIGEGSIDILFYATDQETAEAADQALRLSCAAATVGISEAESASVLVGELWIVQFGLSLSQGTVAAAADSLEAAELMTTDCV